MRMEKEMMLGLRLFTLLNGEFAAVETAFRAYGVVDVRCATVRANNDLRCFCHVVCASSCRSAV